jgi:hypothetical protein
MIDKVPGFGDMVIYEDPNLSVKGDTLIELAQKFNIHYFFETGTYAGEMIKYVSTRHKWKMINSVDLSPRLAERATKLFADMKRVCIWYGNSVDILRTTKIISNPTLFWLDAHASGGVTARCKKPSPIIEELDIVVNDIDHVIVIDDIDLMPKWGIKLQQLMDFINSRKAGMCLEVKDNMLICTPEYMP